MLKHFSHPAESLFGDVFDLRVESSLPWELTLLVLNVRVFRVAIQPLDELFCAHHELPCLHRITLCQPLRGRRRSTVEWILIFFINFLSDVCVILMGMVKVYLFFLNAIIWQMPNWVIKLIDVVMRPTDSQISIIVNINLQWLNRSQKDPLSDVKFPKVPSSSNILQKQRPLNVLLNNFRSRCFLTKSVDNLRFIVEAKDAEAPRVVRRLADPDILTSIDGSAPVLRQVLF